MVLFAFFPGRWFRSTKSGLSTIDGCTCFDNPGCQQGGETSTRFIQHGRSVEGKNPMLAFWCHVNGCGELGYRKSAKVFSVKIYFQAIRKSFHPAKETRYTVSCCHWQYNSSCCHSSVRSTSSPKKLRIVSCSLNSDPSTGDLRLTLTSIIWLLTVYKYGGGAGRFCHVRWRQVDRG